MIDGIAGTDARIRTRKDLLVVEELSVTFKHGKNSVRAVHEMSFAVEQGQILALIGESGSGKTTCCLSILGLLPRSAKASGEICFNGQDILRMPPRQLRRIRGSQISILPQDPGNAFNPRLTVGKQILETIQIHTGVKSAAAVDRARELLEMVDLPASKILRSFPHQLSGGMQQRAMLAVALAARPQLLISDEPTRCLDVVSQTHILQLLSRLSSEQGIAQILVTHDKRAATFLADRTVAMHEGRRIAQEVFLPSNSFTSRQVEFLPENPTPATEAAVLELSGVTHEHSDVGDARDATRISGIFDVCLKIYRGETIGLVGESGAGKSTLARSIIQSPRPQTGKVWFLGQDLTLSKGPELRKLRHGIQMLFQDPMSSINPRWTVRKALEEPLKRFRLTSTECKLKLSEVLAEVSLESTRILDRRTSELSGGQCQRVAIARSLLSNPRLLICDEAVSSLDSRNQSQIIDILLNLRGRQGLAILFISHDIDLVARICSRIAVMKAGMICDISTSRELMVNPTHSYSELLANATAKLSRGISNSAKPTTSIQS